MSVLDSLSLSPSLRESLARATAEFEKNVEDLASFLEPRGIGRADAISARLGRASEWPGFERFAGMMAIPYTRPGNAVVAIKFRCIKPHDCKAEGCQRYDAPAGQAARLYGADHLLRAGDVAAVVEGELKARVVTDTLGVPAVGTSAGVWLDHWPRTLADFDRVLVIADNDEAGLKHAKGKVLKTIPNAELIVPPAEFPKIDDWIVATDVATVRKALGI